MVKRYRSEDNVSYTFGVELTLELIRYQINVINRVYVHPMFKKDGKYQNLVNLCNRFRIPMEENAKPFNVLSYKENPTVIGEFRKYYSQLNDKDHLVLVHPENLYNLGSVINTALGFGITNIAIISPGCDAFNPKVLIASQGARFAVNIQYFDNISSYMKMYGHHELYPFSPDASNNLSEVIVNPSKYFSLIFGNESESIPQEYLEIGTPILIKHTKNIDRLELPIALSIALYEFTKHNI